MLLTETLWPLHWSYIAAGWGLYVVCLFVYRLYLSPLSRFPGPRLAAASLFYEGYYDIVKDGRYPWRIREMHKQYGPVVRINPREIHIQDSDYVDGLCAQRLDKDPWMSFTFGVPLSSFGTWEHDIHRQRRGAINKFFSKASIASRAPVIQDKVLKLCSILEPLSGSGEVVQMDAGFICLTLDIISQFSYGVSYDFLDIPGFDREFQEMLSRVFEAGAFNRQFPVILTIMKSLPVRLVMHLMPSVAGVLRLQESIRVEVKRIQAAWKSQNTSQPSDSVENEAHTDIDSAGVSHRATLFDQILASKLPASEKFEERLMQEGQVLIAAGSETTGRALYLSLVHLLLHPSILSRLRSELHTVMPTPASRPSLQQLEQLPFLTATIKEAIRLSGSTITRSARLSPSSDPIRYKDWVFPPGTPVSITLHDVMMDEAIFPEPQTFNPMRWVVSQRTEDGKEALSANPATDKYFMPFSRGPRACVGMWVAWAELYLTLAHLYRRFDMELYHTGVEDVETARDRFSCYAKRGTQGVRVKITGLRS